MALVVVVLFSRVFADKEALLTGALEMAAEIAARSPVAVQGTKINLVYSRDHSVAEGLHNMVRTLSLTRFPTSNAVLGDDLPAYFKKKKKQNTFPVFLMNGRLFKRCEVDLSTIQKDHLCHLLNGCVFK